MEVLVVDDLFDFRFDGVDAGSEQSVVKDWSECRVSGCIEMGTIESQPFFCLLEQLLRRGKQVDEADARFLCDTLDGLGVVTEPHVVLFAVREVLVARVLEGDGRDQHDARCTLVAVVLRPGVLHQLLQVGRELAEPLATSK